MKTVWFLSVSLLAFLIAGCGPSESEQTKEDTFSVALLTPGPISDAGWSALGYEGLKAIESEMGAEVYHQEASSTQIRDAMKTYARQGVDLVIGHGFEYNEPGVEVGKDFSNTVFVSTSGGMTGENAGAFRFYLEEGFYLAGMMAAKMTKTKKVALIGLDFPSIKSTFKAFIAGVEAADPTVEYIEIYTGQDSDIASSKRAALDVISQGADFIIHQANAGAQGVFNACKEKGVYAFGANADQNSNESGVVIASAVIVAKPAFLKLAHEVEDGTYKGTVTTMGMDSGAIDFVINPDLADQVPDDVRALLEETKEKIKSGEIEVPKDRL